MNWRQKRATIRNWNKLQVKGAIASLQHAKNRGELYPEDSELIGDAIACLMIALDGWKPQPPEKEGLI